MNETRTGGLASALRTYLDIVLFRQGPENLPVSQMLLVVTMAANVLLGLAVGSLLPQPGRNPVGIAVVETLFVVGWYWALLRFAGRPERFLQTASAVFGYQTLLLPAFAFVTWLFLSHPRDAQPDPLTLLALVVFAVWTLAIGSRVIRSATQWPLALCVALMLGQSVVGQFLLLALFPESAIPVGERPTAAPAPAP